MSRLNWKAYQGHGFCKSVDKLLLTLSLRGVILSESKDAVLNESLTAWHRLLGQV